MTTEDMISSDKDISNLFEEEKEEKTAIKSSLKTEIKVDMAKKKITWKDETDDGTEHESYEKEYEDMYEFKEGKVQHFEQIKRDWELQDEINNSFKDSSMITLMLAPFVLSLRLISGSFAMTLNILNMLSLGKIGVIRYSLESLTNFNEIPMQQRKQAGMVFFFLMMIPLVSVSFAVSFFLVLFPLTTLPMLTYLIYIFAYDDSHENGSRVAFMRYWKVWTYFVEYFPIRLVKTMNLDPSKRYLFCYHPHGIISFGAFGNFATDATGFSRLFPGLNLRIATLDLNFKVPFLREYLLAMGACSCSRRACNKILQRGPGSTLVIVIGGADESLLAKPGTYRLNVNRRKGFVRVAIENQVDLVPVLGFGENDVFTTQIFDKGSFGRRMQDLFKKKFGFATPIFWGRDTANASGLGFMPHRTPVIAVVGKPIPCPKIPSYLRGNKLRSTPEGRKLVDDYHQAYVRGLKALYNAYKDKWAANRCESMMLVGRTNSKIKTNVK